ncbi:MAG: hypothetical protein RLZZ540_1563 [Bacteroidota bacterium]|jgi:hypothetical protein
MKPIIKIKNNTFKMIVLFSSLLLLSCNDYMDVNTDKDNPITAPLNFLLTGTQVDLNKTTNFLDESGNVLQVYTHQMTAREEQDQYGAKVNNTGVQNDWQNLYLTLTNIETLIKQAQQSGDLIYVGLGQMQKAYLMSVAVDLWGDVPFSEANQLKGGIIAPKFDNQKEIYTALFQLIETAKTNLKSGQGLKPGVDDLFYGGDTAKWIKFANTFKLKLYNQTRLTSDFDLTGFTALITENNFFTSIDDDFEFKHTQNISPTDERNKLFLESYNSSQFTTYMSPWFYEILKGINPNIHNGNPDPRMKYYFYNQLEAGELPELGDQTTGNPKADYWDKTTGFFSIRFGSQGPWRDFSAENSNTYPGIFPCGGRYDDGGGEIMDATKATGVAPHRILTYDEFLYIQAELIQTNRLTGNATTKLQQAMQASFAKVDQVVKNSGTKQVGIPKLVGSSGVTTFINKIITEFTSGDNTKKLEIIMTQKWVATFGDPCDQYTDYRRTGFPIFANPNSTAKEYQLNNGDAYPLDDSETILNTLYPLSLFWPQNELNVNKNAPVQKNPGTYKIFWDN